MQLNLFRRLCAVLVFSASALSVQAAELYTATLRGSNEVPPTASTATGTGTALIDGNNMTITLTYSGLAANLTATHIHCCAAATANAGVAVDIAAPTGAISGTFTQTVDLNAAATYRAAFVTANGGTVAGARAALVAGLTSGTAYFNIHNAAFPGGEIRGNSSFVASINQSLPVPVGALVPLALIALLAGVAFAKRKRA